MTEHARFQPQTIRVYPLDVGFRIKGAGHYDTSDVENWPCGEPEFRKGCFPGVSEDFIESAMALAKRMLTPGWECCG